jgi:hypothetical protein
MSIPRSAYLAAVLLVLAGLLLLPGCGGVDKARLEADLQTAEQKRQQLAHFVDATEPQLRALLAVATETGDPKLAKAAADVGTALVAAKSALAEVDGVIVAAKASLAQVEADADGKVPWYTVAGGVLLTVLPRVIGAVFPVAKPFAEIVASLLWTATAAGSAAVN